MQFGLALQVPLLVFELFNRREYHCTGQLTVSEGLHQLSFFNLNLIKPGLALKRCIFLFRCWAVQVFQDQSGYLGIQLGTGYRDTLATASVYGKAAVCPPTSLFTVPPRHLAA